ncbi:MAG: nucleotidyl transferase AbiEii/AbiGii toxin family protein [Acidobacteriota bacterium]
MAARKLSEDFILALQSVFGWLSAEGVPGSCIGGVAVSLIAQPRTTQDIDLVIWLDEKRWESFVETGERHDITPRITDAVDFARQVRVLLLRHDSTGINLDISLGALEFERELIERAVTLKMGDLTITVPTPEDLIITKAVAQRPKDLADIDAIVSVTPHLDTQRIRHWVGQFAETLEMPEIVDSVEKVLRYYSTAGNESPSRVPPRSQSKRKKDK